MVNFIIFTSKLIITLVSLYQANKTPNQST